VAARTSALVVVLLGWAGPARADGDADADADGDADATTAAKSDEEILGDAEASWKLEELALRTVYFDQTGAGYQSQAGPPEGPGSQELWVIEPWLAATIRQNERITHQITIPVDVLSAASPDALDAVSTASRYNEAVTADVRTTWKRSETESITTRVGGHWEEPLSSGTIGLGYRRALADDNAAISIAGTLTVDGFDVDDQNGTYLHKSARETASVNLSFSQILTPTTVVDATAGTTWQHGTLAQTWNAVPVVGGEPTGERFPRNRLRHAIAGRIAQHVPLTHSTVKAWYRYYRDDFGLRAHTVELSGYQYVVPWLYARANYRFHRQTGVDFFTTAMPMTPPATVARTADSDLAPFDAHEVGFGLAMVAERAPRVLRKLAFTADYSRYQRTNDLTIHVFAFGVGKLF
jgi:hypothetical protein